MLRELHVVDLGIIDEIRVTFPPGFSVLSGETGAGKSLLVQSFQLLAGDRADAGQVRGGADRLQVTGRFDPPTESGAVAVLQELGAPGDSEVVVRREVTAGGRSRAWINDVAVTVGALQRLAPFVLAVHGQHEQRGLVEPGNHLSLVEQAGGLEALRSRVGEDFNAWQEVRRRLNQEREALATRRDRLDVIAFQLREIQEARPVPGEDESLRQERSILRHAERIGELLALASGVLGEEGGGAALARMVRAVRELNELGLPVAAVVEDLEQARILVEESELELNRTGQGVRPNPARLEAVEARLALLERLARKFGGTIDGVIAHGERLAAEREHLAAVEESLARWEEEEQAAAAALISSSLELARMRASAAVTFVDGLTAVLGRLGMERVALELRQELRTAPDGSLEVEGQRVMPGPDGLHDGELFMVSNPGEPSRPLARIASGGELSRVHLAIRTVLRDRRGGRDALTLLFDEVDAGIGGRVADELGELLAELGRRDQVLVVTHLPQVAGRAGHQVVVSKESCAGRTVTRVTAVAGEERVQELVRMLGGGPGTPAAEEHARQLLGRP